MDDDTNSSFLESNLLGLTYLQAIVEGNDKQCEELEEMLDSKLTEALLLSGSSMLAFLCLEFKKQPAEIIEMVRSHTIKRSS